MDDLFAPPGTEWTPVSPALGRLRRATLIGASALLALTGIVTGVVIALPLWLVGVVAVLLLAAGAYGWVLIGRSVRSWGYAERDEDLYIKHGVLFRQLVCVPYGRMQYVDVTAGPLEQAFGIAGVRLHTASPGTSAHIPGLPKDDAARLRDRLTSLGEAQSAGL